jgi:hypothetical protein
MVMQAAAPALINASNSSDGHNWVLYAAFFSLFGIIAIFERAMGASGRGRPDPLPPEPEAIVIDSGGAVVATIEASPRRPITSVARRLGRWVGSRRRGRNA